MSYWRVGILTTLFLVPFVFLIGVGSYHLYETHWAFRAWWPMALCFSAALFLALRWQRNRTLLPRMDFSKPPHGTDRDAGAWKLVEARAAASDQIAPARLNETNFYFQTAQDMALEIARYYHPGARDPYGTLTVPEVLAVAELASRDLSDLVQTYVPGSHLLTINDWKRAHQATDWYRKGRILYWAASALVNPVETGIRYAASQLGMGQTWDLLQQNMMQWFYTAYIHRLGTYLIELHSGRLRVGAERYRQLLAQHKRPEQAETTPPEQAGVEPAAQVTLTLMGQVKMGKSSLANALLGEQKAKTDVLPMTSQITRYRLAPTGISSRMDLLDTVGYGHTGPTEDQLAATEDASRQSDVLLMVLHARNPARQADVQMLDRLKEWFAARPELRMPPVIGVVTHIDGLTPAMEWSPPYDWLDPKTPKEKSIRQAVEAAKEQFGTRLTAVVPVCVAPGKVFGVREALLPALAERLDEAHGVALLRCLHAEADTGQVRKLFSQILAAGKQAAKIIWERAGT